MTAKKGREVGGERSGHSGVVTMVERKDNAEAYGYVPATAPPPMPQGPRKADGPAAPPPAPAAQAGRTDAKATHGKK